MKLRNPEMVNPNHPCSPAHLFLRELRSVWCAAIKIASERPLIRSGSQWTFIRGCRKTPPLTLTAIWKPYYTRAPKTLGSKRIATGHLLDQSNR
jgi:hypothetical protein